MFSGVLMQKPLLEQSGIKHALMVIFQTFLQKRHFMKSFRRHRTLTFCHFIHTYKPQVEFYSQSTTLIFTEIVVVGRTNVEQIKTQKWYNKNQTYGIALLTPQCY